MLANLGSSLRRSLGVRVLAGLLAAVVLLVVSMDVLLLRLHSKNLREQFLQEGSAAARLLAQTVRLGVFSEDEQTLSVPVDAVLDQEDVRAVAVYSLERELIRRSRLPEPARAGGELSLPVRLPPTEGYSETADTLIFRAWVQTQRAFSSEEAMYFAPPEGGGRASRPIGFVVVTVSKDRLHRALRTSMQAALLLGALFFVGGGVASVLVARQAMRPLRRLVEEMRASAGVAPEDPSDLGVLSRTYTRLVEQLDQAFETIRDLNDGLERKVQERTRELRETQAQLIQAEKMAALGQLVAGVAHEVNNSVNFISGALPLLEQILREFRSVTAKASEPASAERLLGRLADTDQLIANIEEGARRAAQIVRDLRDFARVDQVEFTPADLHRGIDATLKLLHHEYRHRIEIRREYAEEALVIECLPGQMNQVFMNLLLNAAQAIPDRGTVTIRTWREGERVHVAFRDDGVGIPDDVLHRIFEPFFTTKEVGKGTGLGLGISYGIVRKHRGEILVRSRVGEGTEFDVVLPVSQPGTRNA